MRRHDVIALCRDIAYGSADEGDVARSGRLVMASFTSRRALMLDVPVFAGLPSRDLVVLACPDAPLGLPSGLHSVSLSPDEPLSTRWEIGAVGPREARHLVATASAGEPPPYAHDGPDRVLDVKVSAGPPAVTAVSALLDAVADRLPPDVAEAARPPASTTG